MNKTELRRRIAAITYRALDWARHRVAPGIRSLLGVLLMIGGVLGFLPVLGFWMFPLGLAFVALDVPPARPRIDRWMLRLAAQAGCSSVDAAELNPARAPGLNSVGAASRPRSESHRAQEAAPTTELRQSTSNQ